MDKICNLCENWIDYPTVSKEDKSKRRKKLHLCYFCNQQWDKLVKSGTKRFTLKLKLRISKVSDKKWGIVYPGTSYNTCDSDSDKSSYIEEEETDSN